MQRTERRQLAGGLIHEDPAAVDRRTDRIGRDEQDAELLVSLGGQCEAVTKVSAQRPAERLGIGDSGEGAGTSARAESFRELEECAPQTLQIGPLRRVAEENAPNRAGESEEEEGQETRPFV